jgi:hypothetical protein
MIKGTDKKYELSEWKEPVAKVSSSITCFPKEDNDPIKETRKKYAQLPPKSDYKDDVLMRVLIQADKEVLQLRFIEQRCLNCGKEKTRWATFICNDCRLGHFQLVKRALKKHFWKMTQTIPISRTQIQINERRRKGYK